MTVANSDGTPHVPVLFSADVVVSREFTAAGVGIPRRLPDESARRFDLLYQLLDGPFLEGFELGLCDEVM